MTRSHLLTLAALILWFLGSSASNGWAQPSGRPLDDLIKDLSSNDKKDRREAAYQLQLLGSKAEPAVPALIKALDDSEQQVWFHSIMTLSAIGPGAKPAIPRLMKGLSGDFDRRRRRRSAESQTWYRHAYALGRIGPEAIPSLVEGLKDDNAGVQAGSAKALGFMQAKAKEAIPGLLPLLSDESDFVRMHSAQALGEIGKPALPHLAKALASENTDARHGAAQALAWMGREAASTAPALRQAYDQEKDLEVRAALIKALSKSAYQANQFMPLLLEALKIEHEDLRQETFNAILLLEPAEKTSVPPLIQQLESKDESQAQTAAFILGRLGPEAASAVPALIGKANQTPMPPEDSPYLKALVDIGADSIPALIQSLQDYDLDSLSKDHWAIVCMLKMGDQVLEPLIHALEDNSPAIQVAAATVLMNMGDSAMPAVPNLVTLISDKQARVRSVGLAALLKVGADFNPLLPQLDKALEDPSPEVRKLAAQALAKVDKNPEELIPPLLKALKDEDTSVQTGAAMALGGLGPEAASALDPLRGALKSAQDPAFREALVIALGKLGPAAAPAVEELIGLAQDREPSSNLKVALNQAFGLIGEKAGPALPELLRHTKDSHSETRASAFEAIGRINSESKDVLPSLKAGLTDDNREVRMAAAQSIGRLGPSARSATPELFAMLNQDKEWPVAMDALRNIQVNSVDHLTKALAFDEPSIRKFACEVLGRLGPEAKTAVPELIKLEKDQYDFVRNEAARAIRRINR